MPPIVRRRKLNALPMSEADRQGAITPDASSCCGSQAQGEKAGGTDCKAASHQPVRRLFSGLRRRPPASTLFSWRTAPPSR